MLPIDFKKSDYDRLLQWAELLSGQYYYNTNDAKLAIKIQAARKDFLQIRHLNYKNKKCQESSTITN